MHLEVVHFHRPNQTFESLAELISVMASDEAAGRAWFAKQAKEGREE
jgi:FAD synthase